MNLTASDSVWLATTLIQNIKFRKGDFNRINLTELIRQEQEMEQTEWDVKQYGNEINGKKRIAYQCISITVVSLIMQCKYLKKLSKHKALMNIAQSLRLAHLDDGVPTPKK